MKTAYMMTMFQIILSSALILLLIALTYYKEFNTTNILLTVLVSICFVIDIYLAFINLVMHKSKTIEFHYGFYHCTKTLCIVKFCLAQCFTIGTTNMTISVILFIFQFLYALSTLFIYRDICYVHDALCKYIEHRIYENNPDNKNGIAKTCCC